MAKPANGRTRILLLAGTTAGLAALPPDLTAQAGSGEPGRALGAWVEEAREGPFHLATGPGTPDIPTVAPAFDIRVANARDVRSRPAPAPHGTVSPGRVFAYTLAGATIPLLPAMIVVGPYGSNGYDAVAAYLLGGLATLVTVPVAARAAGSQGLGRTLAGTVAGFVVGIASMGFVAEVPNSELWAIPVFSVTMTSITTLIATAPPGS